MLTLNVKLCLLPNEMSHVNNVSQNVTLLGQVTCHHDIPYNKKVLFHKCVVFLITGQKTLKCVNIQFVLMVTERLLSPVGGVVFL